MQLCLIPHIHSIVTMLWYVGIRRVSTRSGVVDSGRVFFEDVQEAVDAVFCVCGLFFPLLGKLKIPRQD